MSDCLPCKKKKTLLERVKEITQGYAAVIFPTEETEKLSAKRMEICLNCKDIKELMKVNKEPVWQCGICSCPLFAATRSKDYKCVAGKW